jgi:PCO_ADO
MSFVRYIHLTEVPEQYSIGIFVFPPFSRIPLHDHPEMCVLSRLLYGDLQCLSLDLPDGSCAQDTLSCSTLAGQPTGQQQQQEQGAYPTGGLSPPPGLPAGSRRAYKNAIKHLHAPDVSLLFPYKGNLHEFYAGPNGAAVLDILLPPYDVDHDRDCTFYDITEDTFVAAAAGSQQQHHQMMMVDDMMMMTSASGMMIDPSPIHSRRDETLTFTTPQGMMDPSGGELLTEERIPCWIVPTHQPHDFHCLSGKYQKLGANVISMQDG